MEVKVKAIAGFKASVEAVGTGTIIKAVVSVENEAGKEILATFALFGGINISYLTADEDKIISVVTDVTHFVKYCKVNAAKLGTVSATEAKGK